MPAINAVNAPQSILANSVSNAALDPFQGFDVDVWVQNQADGTPVMLGQFTSITMTIRNATEAYLEFDQRIPRYLDGEFQIAWVMERGLLDLRVLAECYGFDSITRAARINRSPRFTITFEVNAPDLNSDRLYQAQSGQNYNSNALTLGVPSDYNLGVNSGTNSTSQLTVGRSAGARSTYARVKLEFCKVDSWNMAAASGRNVVANQWQGVAEGYSIITSDNSTNVYDASSFPNKSPNFQTNSGFKIFS
jgi:hypothetical protein